MHSRLKELSEAAEKYADYNFKGEPFWTEAYESKFAELIVLKCTEIADTAEPFLASDLIKEHFGVVE
jgi:hypothetical protein